MNTNAIPTSPSNKIIRDEKGRVLPGTGPLNPTGRPKTTFNIRSEAAKIADEALAELKTIMKDSRQAATARVQAANIILHVAGAFVDVGPELEGGIEEKLQAFLAKRDAPAASSSTLPSEGPSLPTPPGTDGGDNT